MFLLPSEIENPKILSLVYHRYKTDGKEKEAVLEEDDDLWVRVRHRHIAVVLEYVSLF
jgi:hypothetical protein